jgi:hypothetical protein
MDNVHYKPSDSQEEPRSQSSALNSETVSFNSFILTIQLTYLFTRLVCKRVSSPLSMTSVLTPSLASLMNLKSTLTP